MSGVVSMLVALLLPLGARAAAAPASSSARAADGPLPPSELQHFARDGYVVVRGVITGAALEAAQAEGRKLVAAPTGVGGTSYSSLAFHQLDISPALRQVALSSRLPKIVAQLMSVDVGGGARPTPAADRDVRVLKDAFLAYEPGKRGCGWHRDDSFFWPCPPDAPGPGVNAWVALSPYKSGNGGGLALAAGSHRAWWRERAIRAINRPRGRMPVSTCDLARNAPWIHALCELRRREFELAPGDALIHTRYCFHRAAPLTNRGRREYDGRPLMRYSIRYMPGGATLDANSLDPAIKKAGIGGRTLASLGSRHPPVKVE